MKIIVGTESYQDFVFASPRDLLKLLENPKLKNLIFSECGFVSDKDYINWVQKNKNTEPDIEIKSLGYGYTYVEDKYYCNSYIFFKDGKSFYDNTFEFTDEDFMTNKDLITFLEENPESVKYYDIIEIPDKIEFFIEEGLQGIPIIVAKGNKLYYSSKQNFYGE